MERINYHTHTSRCKHAGGVEEDYVKAAIEKHLCRLGFSDHAPYSDDRFGLRMAYKELDDYRREVLRLKEKYQKQLSISLGLEIEFDKREMDYYQYLKEAMGMDYLLLGQHVYMDKNDQPMNIYFLEKTGETSHYLDYANSLKEAMETGIFPMIAHPDVIFINRLPWDRNCEAACDKIVEAAVLHNTILELNANGIRRGTEEYEDGIRYPYPHEKFWKKVADAGVKTIINSDCHDPSDVWDESMEQAYELAKEWNLNLVYEF